MMGKPKIEKDIYVDVRSLFNRLNDEMHDLMDEDRHNSVVFYATLRDKLSDIMNFMDEESGK